MMGQRLRHFRILEKIGAGGMGEVYRAHDEQLDRDVAIKVLPAASFHDATARARLLREARTASKLNHPHICTIHEVGEADGQAYIAMELVEGQPLSARLADGALPPEQVLRYALQLADALAHAHERGVVHRDLKSANVIVTPEGRAKVLDFGLAKRLNKEELDEATTLSQDLSQPGTIVGTLAYMPPEQLRGEPADARSDVWALGVMLHEMASGERPFQGKTGFELSSAILNQPPSPLPPEVPPELRGVIERCLEKEPGRRYQRGGEVRAVLEAIQSGSAIPAWTPPKPTRRWLVLAASLVVVIAAAVALGRFRGGGAAPRISSMAVLPLQNLSGDPEQEYFVEGTHEALITDLAKISALRVIARPSVMRYRGASKPVSEIARELKVDAVLTGSVVRSGDRVRITAQLIRAATDEHL
jgi:serine/threonine protein kinase